MEKVDLPEMQNGQWRVEKFTTDQTDFHSMFRGRNVPLGETYTRLMRGHTLVMSDTPAEMCDHMFAVYKATGHCLLNGLGLGMVLKNILLKPDVKSVDVIEISQELIDMISPYYQDKRVTFICANALTYKPPMGLTYDMAWHDIWDNICADNLPEMATLHRKYGGRVKWQDSWCKEECKRYR